MFCMVTLVCRLIHVYSLGDTHEELQPPWSRSPMAGLLRRRAGSPLLSVPFALLYMLGLAIAGNLAMVFAFWELVGICSYLLLACIHRPQRLQRGQQGILLSTAFVISAP